MTLIRVNPESVRGYGRQAQSAFETMHQSLVELVDEVVAVRYFGPNAVAFKTECGRMSADFANRLHMDMGAMADAVRRSTSNIAASLGGAPIHIQIDNRPIAPPVPQAAWGVDIVGLGNEPARTGARGRRAAAPLRPARRRLR